jgi:hypothetical protein
MQLMAVVGLCLSLIAAPVLAQQAMSGDETKAWITGKTIEFSDGMATYKADGKYEYYVKTNGATSRGKWSIQGDRVCVDFDTGRNRCDQYLKDGTKTFLKTSSGTSYQVTGIK